MKKIAIVEFMKNHYDYIISVYSVLSASAKDEERKNIFIFTTKDTYENLILEVKLNKIPINKENIIIFSENSSIKSRLKKINMHNFDITIFCSISLTKDIIQYIYYFRSDKSNKYITIHNINSWLFLGQLKLRNLLKYPIKRYILNNAKGVILLNNNLKKYFDENFNLPSVVLPFKMPIVNYEVACYNEENINIVIPGIVDESKRNYKNIINLFEKLFLRYTDLRLIFLGKLESPKIEKQINSINYKSLNIVYFKEYVDQRTFNNYMKNATFIFAPIKNNLFHGSAAKEYYGTTKASGAEFDAIKHGKPLIINSFYKINENLANFIIYYDCMNDLSNKLELILNNRELLRLYIKNAYNFSKQYKSENILYKIEKEYNIRDFFDLQKDRTIK